MNGLKALSACTSRRRWATSSSQACEQLYDVEPELQEMIDANELLAERFHQLRCEPMLLRPDLQDEAQ